MAKTRKRTTKKGQDKKGKKFQTLSLPLFPLRSYKIIKLEEVNAHDARLIQILLESKSCLDFIYEAAIKVEKENDKQMQKENWNTYVNCDLYPRPDQPPEVRAYKTRLKMLESENIEGTFNWVFSVDERSILTQRCAQELTRRTLSKTITQLGWQYNEMVRDYFEILRRTATFLRDNSATAKVKPEILTDIVALKNAISKEIYETFNSLTYRILSMGDASMKSLGPVTEEYFFSGDNFRIHIWTLKNVPIRFTHLDEPRMVANLHNLDILLHIPYSMLRPNLCVQAVHIKVDTLSEQAKSFILEIPLHSKDFNTRSQVLTESLMRDHEMQNKIQENVRTEIMKAYSKQEEVIGKALQRLKKMKKTQKKKANSKILELEAMIMSPKPHHLEADEYPDVYAEFLEAEQTKFEDFLNIAYDPATLNLDSDEINLRRFVIVGGAYQLNFVQKPLNVKIGNIGMTWQCAERKLIIEKDVRIEEPSPSGVNSVVGTVNCLNCDEFPSPIDIVKISVDPTHPLFVLVFRVPQYLCYWGEPIACHYEEIQEIVNIENLEDEKSIEEFIKPTDISHAQPTLRNKLEVEKLDKLNETLLKAHRINLHYSPPNYFEYRNISSTSLPNLPAVAKILDYHMDSPLTAEQLHLIEELCLPQMLSSYKFPKEIQEEATKKAKGKRFLPSQGIKEQQPPPPGFNFNESQNNPERVFMVFGQTKDFEVTKQLQPFHNVLPTVPRTFYQLVKTLTLIKKFFQNTSNQIFLLPSFNQNMDLEKRQKKRRARSVASLKKTHEKSKQKSKSFIFPKADSLTKLKGVSSVLMKKTNVKRRSSLKRRPGRSSKEVNTSRRTSIEHRPILKQESRRPSKENHVPVKRESWHSSVESDFSPKMNVETIIKSVKRRSIPLIKSSASSRRTSTSKRAEEPVTHDYLPGEILHKPKDTKIIQYSHWTTKHIKYSRFIREEQIFMIETDRLGIFGFACKRYEHFPFKYWAMQPSEADPANEVVFTLDTQHVRCVLIITGQGIRGYVSEPIGINKRNNNPKIYLIIKDPIKDIAVLRKLFEEKNLNIFANGDASFYVDNGYHSVKHLATENHTHYCMALHSTQMKFNSSQWNRSAERRDIILQFDSYERPSDNSLEVRVTPEGVTFVEITERCPFTLEANDVLTYNQTWRNFEVRETSIFRMLVINVMVSISRGTVNIFIEDAVNIEKEVDKRFQEEKWNAYVNCDPYPQPDIPPEVRAYREKLKDLENVNIQETINWLLSANEYSICTQCCEYDFTRRALLKTKPQLGLLYDKMVADYLEILRRLDTFLRDNKSTTKVKTDILVDIIELRRIINTEIYESFNSLTYRILSSGEAYTKSLDGISEEYCFSGDKFRIHIWALKNVPIRFMHLPLLHEYEMQLELQQRVRSEIMESYRKHQEIVKSSAIRLRKLTRMPQATSQRQPRQHARRNKNREELKRLINAPKPQRLGDDEYPEIFEEFLKVEEMQYEKFVEVVYDPANLNLSYDEINLRKYVILNGVYQLNFVRKPLNVNIGNIDMIWHSEDRKLIIEKELRIHEPTSVDSKSSVKRISCLNCEASISPIDVVKQSIDPEHPWFVLIFHIPDFLCYWSEPIACHYEEVQETVKNGKIENRKRERDLTKLINTGRTISNLQSRIELEGDKLDDVLTGTHSQSHFQSKYSMLHKFSSSSLQSRAGDLKIRDFLLDAPLTKEQLDLIKTFCVPEILSSYKFPREVELEKEEIEKAKGKDRKFSFGQPTVEKQKPGFGLDIFQNHPERIHTIFAKTTPFHIIGRLETFQSTLPSLPKTFYQLVKTLILIKRIYQSNARRILNLNPFVSDMDLNRFKKKIKKKLLKNIQKQIQKRHIQFPEPSKQIFQKYAQKSRFSQRKSMNEGTKEARFSSKSFGTPLQVKKTGRTLAKRELKFSIKNSESPSVANIVNRTSVERTSKLPSKNFDTPLLTNITTRTSARRESRLSSKNVKAPLLANTLGRRTVKREATPSSKELEISRRSRENDRRSKKRKRTLSPKNLDKSEKKRKGHRISKKRKPAVSSKHFILPKMKDDSRLSANRASIPSSKELYVPAPVNISTIAKSMKLKSKGFDRPRKTTSDDITSVKREPRLISKEHEIPQKEDVNKRTPLKRESRLPSNKFDVPIHTGESRIVKTVKQESTVPARTTLSLREAGEKDRINGDSVSMEMLDGLKDTEIITYSHWTTKHIKHSRFIKKEQIFVVETDRLDPIKDIAVLRKLFEEKNLNIFANDDASFYIDNGYHSVKHLATENHTHYCMALHSTHIKFNFNEWNRFAERRNIILQFSNYKWPSSNNLKVRVTPEGVTFVEVSEECPFTLKANTMLRYTLTWRNFELYSDLHRAICSVFPDAISLRCKDSKLIGALLSLLHEIRPLSFS
uniref:Uncharacterized protein n=1 Tax=Glossina pallidipes TaxID=7398 RepID=A0A1A9ZD80_GLOPL